MTLLEKIFGNIPSVPGLNQFACMTPSTFTICIQDKKLMNRVRTIPVLGYWPILASIGWYWYWPNTFLSNRAHYWADNSLRRRLATHDDLISRSSMRALA